MSDATRPSSLPLITRLLDKADDIVKKRAFLLTYAGLWLFVFTFLSSFPYISEDEGLNFRLGSVGQIWPDGGVLWAGLIQILRLPFELPHMRYVTTALVLFFCWAVYRILRTFARPCIAFATPLLMIFGVDLLVNVHKVRPEAFIVATASLAMLFLHRLSQQHPRLKKNAWIKISAIVGLLSFGFFHIHTIGLTFVPVLWACAILGAYRAYGRRIAYYVGMGTAAMILLSAFLGAMPYLSPNALETIKLRMTNIPIYDATKDESVISQAYHHIANIQGDNFGRVNHGYPAKTRQREIPISFAVILLGLAHIAYVLRRSRGTSKMKDDDFARFMLQCFSVGSFVSLFLFAGATNRLSNYYMAMVLPFGIVTAATLLLPRSAPYVKAPRLDQAFHLAGLTAILAYFYLAVVFTATGTLPFRNSLHAEAFWATRMLAESAGCHDIAASPPEFLPRNVKYNTVDNYHSLWSFLVAVSHADEPGQCPQRYACLFAQPSKQNKCVIMNLPSVKTYYVGPEQIRGEKGNKIFNLIKEKMTLVGYLVMPNYRNDPAFPFFAPGGKTNPVDSDLYDFIEAPGTPNYYFGGLQQLFILKTSKAWDSWCSCAFDEPAAAH